MLIRPHLQQRLPPLLLFAKWNGLTVPLLHPPLPLLLLLMPLPSFLSFALLSLKPSLLGAKVVV
jgi:hypothetical protein